ncbi:MAG: rhodanese-like domain-containing protein [Magnetospirillum sp.]|nr:rhodanese-like domain-containing protein [Magnetospirillum sp.]
MPDASTASSQRSYAGEITPAEAWRILTEVPAARLIDVRTQAEWVYVGVPDLAPLGKEVALVSWQLFPAMTVNAGFAAQLSGVAGDRAAPLLFLCRSGVRSKAAAELMTSLGYGRCYNVTDGFEGPHDDTRHRGGKAGWKASGLPWVQG